MEEERTTRRAPLLVALAGILALAAIWATVAIAGSSSAPAAKPVKAKAKATPTQTSYGTKGLSGKAGGHDCPLDGGTSNDL